MHFLNIHDQQLEVRRIEGSDALAPIVFLHEGLGCVGLWTQRGLDWPLAVCQATGRAGVVYSRLWAVQPRCGWPQRLAARLYAPRGL